MLRKLFLIGLICAFMAPASVFAEKGKWSITPYGGASYIARDMVNFDTATLTTTAFTFSDGSSVTAGGVATTVGDLRFDATHNTPVLAGFDVGYSLIDDIEVFGGFEYVTASGKQTRALQVTSSFTYTDSGGTATIVSGGDTADIKLGTYNSWSIKVGATKYFPIAGFTPYIGGYGGFKHVDKMDVKVQLTDISAGTTLNSFKIKFYKSTNTGFFGFHTGINKDFNVENVPLLFGIRVRGDYTPELTGDDTDVGESAVTGGGNTNDAGAGWDIGLTAQIGVRF